MPTLPCIVCPHGGNQPRPFDQVGLWLTAKADDLSSANPVIGTSF
jgi:hypothetical protein